VAYRSQLRERRARTHAATADALEALHPDTLDMLAALISTHWERANEPLRAAQWGARAAAWSGQRGPDDALEHWRRVRTLVGDQPETPEATRLALAARVWIVYTAWRLGLPDDEIELVYREALQLAAATGDTLAMAMVRSAHAMGRGTAGSLEEAIASSQEARRLAEEAGNLELQVSISPGLWLQFAGRNREALADFDRILEAAGGDLQLGRQFLGTSAVVYATIFGGAAKMELGRLREAHAAAEEGLRLAREIEDVEQLCTANGLFGVLSLQVGEPGDGLARAREGLSLADRLGSSAARVVTRLLAGSAHLAREQHDDARCVLAEGLEIIRESRSGLQAEAQLLSLLAHARLGLGDPEGARAAAAEGVQLAVTRGARIQEAVCRLPLGRALLVLDHRRQAKSELEHAIHLAGEDGPVYVPHALLALADLAHLRGDQRERLRLLADAHRLFEQHGATGHAQRVAADLATAAA
jgi:tetratricopeptide (TPR) repeat protein